MIVLDNGDIRFTSGRDALVFAFNVSYQAYDRPMMNRMAAPSLGKGGLAGLEAPAQAGMIRAEVQAFGKLAEANNRKEGFEAPLPVLIGNAERAQLVMLGGSNEQIIGFRQATEEVMAGVMALSNKEKAE
jgi:hypothetical protein